jgi:hypothetical protein
VCGLRRKLRRSSFAAATSYITNDPSDHSTTLLMGPPPHKLGQYEGRRLPSHLGEVVGGIDPSTGHRSTFMTCFSTVCCAANGAVYKCSLRAARSFRQYNDGHGLKTMMHKCQSRLTHCGKRDGYSITSSARASTVAGSSRPSAFAALRLITVSYLTGACTGRSPGFSPLRMRSRPRGAAVRSHQFHRRSGRH